MFIALSTLLLQATVWPLVKWLIQCTPETRTSSFNYKEPYLIVPDILLKDKYYLADIHLSLYVNMYVNHLHGRKEPNYSVVNTLLMPKTPCLKRLLSTRTVAEEFIFDVLDLANGFPISLLFYLTTDHVKVEHVLSSQTAGSHVLTSLILLNSNPRIPVATLASLDCKRFHFLEEFDEGKRSCRKRLHGHNRRRRKLQPDTSRAASVFFGDQANDSQRV